uniref:Uncharacterized protein n=1 Tax=Arundo donax TaxID=35708 RepID=A0A0A9FQF3_ARUDO
MGRGANWNGIEEFFNRRLIHPSPLT